MSISKLIAQHVKAVHYGGNWTSVNLKDTLTDITWQQAITPVGSFNTIAVLVYHISYYTPAITKVLEGNPLVAKDSESFTHPIIENETDWNHLKQKLWDDVENMIAAIEKLPDNQLESIFEQEKYGNYFRNLIGFIEHFHYHLGQIVILKKLVQSK